MAGVGGKHGRFLSSSRPIHSISISSSEAVCLLSLSHLLRYLPRLPHNQSASHSLFPRSLTTHVAYRFKIIPHVSGGVVFPSCNGISATREVQTPVWVICETWQRVGFPREPNGHSCAVSSSRSWTRAVLSSSPTAGEEKYGWEEEM